MSKHPTDYWFSPLLLLVPVPFVLASFLPVNLDHPPKAQQVAAVSSESEPAAPAASAPRAAAVSNPQHFPR